MCVILSVISLGAEVQICGYLQHRGNFKVSTLMKGSSHRTPFSYAYDPS